MKIFVVGSNKNKFLPLDNIREKFLIDQKHEGDNIDCLNPWYCELTGLYYMWKHNDDDIVGLEHYRRYFVNDRNQLLSENEISNLLKDNDIICKRQPYSFSRPPITFFKTTHKLTDLQRFLSFAKVYAGQDYYDACVKHLYSDHHLLGNMFICKKELIDEYCEFIFDLTFAFMNAEHFYKRKLTPRIIGYFTEFLFGAYLYMKKKKIVFKNVRFVR